MSVVRIPGLLLAAGGGTRFGRPKALAETDGEPWVRRSIRALQAAECAPILVVIGAQAEAVRLLLPTDVIPVLNSDWETGLGSSLRAGLQVLATSQAPGVLVTLVDLPGVTASTVSRMLATPGADAPNALLQGYFDGRPGHPVVIGRAHWPRLRALLGGDRGAGAYLAANGAVRVPLGTAAEGADLDELPR